MEKNKILQEFLRAVQLRTAGAKYTSLSVTCSFSLLFSVSTLEDIMVSLKDHFPALRDDRFPTSSTSDIDCVVSDLHRLITAMKFHRNALVPAHQLPDDVLSLIFRYHCFGDHDTDIYTHPRWANIMHVCRRWYNLVVQDGFLWSFIDADGGYPHADCIAR
ncbi:hypothetical protein CPB85DRAFT_409589 [Mucidula mucida]|nr:hypothetical protein CPB85DRAFT_409589 [Mucidula mucida]